MDELCHAGALIPAYDCALTVGQVIAGVRALGLETIVVDDGSTDDTAAAALAAGARVLQHPANRGKGDALLTGFREALRLGWDYVATLDADGQHDPADLPRLLAAAPGADLVVGQRQIDRHSMPRASLVGNSISTFFIGLFCGKRFPDTQCGYRIYSRKLLTQLPLRGGRFETETELLMRAARLGLTLRWAPVRTIYVHGSDGPRETNFRDFRDTLRVIGVVLRSPRFPKERP